MCAFSICCGCFGSAFCLVKKDNKTEVKANVYNKSNLKLSNGWLGSAETLKAKEEVSVRRSMAKAESSTTLWYAHPLSMSKIYVFCNDYYSQIFSNWEYDTDGSKAYNYAIMVPATYAGASIDSICNMFYDVENIKNAKIWLHNITIENNSFGIPTSAANAEYSQDVKSGEILGTINEDGKNYLQFSYFKLDKSFKVGTDGCLIGFEFEAPSDARNICSSGSDEDGGYYMKVPYQGQTGWLNLYGSTLGNLCIGARIDVKGLSSANVAVNNVEESVVKTGTDTEIPVNVQNAGFSAVNSLSYVLTINGAKQVEQTLTLSENASYNKVIAGGTKQAFVYLPIKSIASGENYVKVEITKVNGTANESTSNTGDGYVLGVDKSADRVSVVEEATSTECGWCPRGTVGMEKVKKALGDKVIVLSTHGQQSGENIDPMECSDYALYHQLFGGSYPTAFINRASSADPYAGFYENVETDAKGNATLAHFTLDQSVNTVANAIPAEGSVSLVATPTDMANVKVTATANFLINRETVPYSFVYVLTEDGMTGTDVPVASGNSTLYQPLWSQFNYYSQELIDYYKKQGQDVSSAFRDTDMDAYKNGDPMYKEPNGYNNVVVGAWGDAETASDGTVYSYAPILGYKDAFASIDEISANTAYTDSRTLNLASKSLIQSHKNLKLAVLLINENNYTIVNAAQVALDFTAGINSVQSNSNATEVARYNVNGVRMSAPQKGLNIVKMADGTVKKIMVK